MAQKLTEQFIKMQKLAGIITESQAVEAISTLNEALNKDIKKEAYEKPNIDQGKNFVEDLEAVYKAMKDAIQAQIDIKQLINFRVPVDKQKELKKYYLDKMKHERVMYPGLFEAKTEENLKEGKIADFAKTAIKGVENILKQNLVAASNALDELIDRGRITPEQAKQTLMNDDFRKEIKKVEMQKGSLARYSNTAIWRKVSDWVNDNYPKD